MEPWMEDEIVRSIPKEKLEFLSEMFLQSKGKNKSELIKELVPLIKQAKERGLSLTPQEMKLAITAIKRHSSPEENDRIDAFLKKANARK